MFFNLRFSIHFACHFPLTVWHWTKVEKLQSEIWPALFFYYAAAGQELPSQRKTLIASQKYQTLSQHLKRRQIHMTEFSSVIPFKKSPCCFASPRGPKSVVLQFVNDTVLKNWKQVKQVRYPSLRYQTIKQVGHLVINVIGCSLRSWWDMFWRPSQEKIGLRRVSVSFRSKQRLRIWPSAKRNKRHFLRGLWLSFFVLCSETARKCLLRRLREDWDQVKRSGEG